MTKKKKGKFDVVKAVKENSRTLFGTLPTTKVVPHKNKLADRTAKYPKQNIEEE